MLPSCTKETEANGERTVTVQLADCEAVYVDVAVIVAVPRPTACIFPFASTVATVGSDDFHVTV